MSIFFPALAILGWLLVGEVMSDLTDDDKKSILDTHNQLRGQVQPPAANMAKLVWNAEVAKSAQEYANECYFGHPYVRRAGSFRLLGENLSLTSASKPNWGDLVTMWYNEQKDYNYDSRKCSGRSCGHYTQVAWATTTDLGCGATWCDKVQGVPVSMSGFLLVCRYGPTGNYYGQKPYKKGSPCSSCPSDRTYCQDKLCAAI